MFTNSDYSMGNIFTLPTQTGQNELIGSRGRPSSRVARVHPIRVPSPSQFLLRGTIESCSEINSIFTCCSGMLSADVNVGKTRLGNPHSAAPRLCFCAADNRGYQAALDDC